MSSHERSDKKSSLNKLKQKKNARKQHRNQKLKYGGLTAVIAALLVSGSFLATTGDSPASNSSITGKAVHWHADYRITVCGENRIPRNGPMLAHTHGETTFHLEGVRQNREQATLGWILDQLGTEFTNDSIYGQTSCDGEPANLTVEANGETLEHPENYIVRDGDNIEIELG